MTAEPSHLETAEWGEKKAERMLRKKKYRVVGRRVRVGTRDEIDLVARDGDILVFVEVKTRRSERYGRPIEAVDRKKRHTTSRAAIRFLKHLRHPPVCFRFDVVEVVGTPDDKEPTVRHIENAFTLDRRYSLPF